MVTNKLKSVAIIDPGTRIAEIDTFNKISRLCPWPVTFHLPGIFGTLTLANDTAPDAIIVLGSGASVHNSIDWQDTLRQWLAHAMATNTPILGICYGHQLLAKMLGGEVAFCQKTHEKYSGFREIALTSTIWMGHYNLVVSHKEEVTFLGPDCQQTGSSQQVNIEAFQHMSKPIWGIQAHPEATRLFLANQGTDLKQLTESSFDDGTRFFSAFFSHIQKLYANHEQI